MMMAEGGGACAEDGSAASPAMRMAESIAREERVRTRILFILGSREESRKHIGTPKFSWCAIRGVLHVGRPRTCAGCVASKECGSLWEQSSWVSAAPIFSARGTPHPGCLRKNVILQGLHRHPCVSICNRMGLKPNVFMGLPLQRKVMNPKEMMSRSFIYMREGCETRTLTALCEADRLRLTRDIGTFSQALLLFYHARQWLDAELICDIVTRWQLNEESAGPKSPTSGRL